MSEPTVDPSVVFSPGQFMTSWDEESPQAAYLDLVQGHPYVRPDGMPVVSRRDELIAFNRYPGVHANDGVHFNLGSKRPLIPLDLDGEAHRRYRKLLDPIFAPSAVAKYEPVIRSLAHELIDNFAADGEVEFMSAFCVPLPSNIFMRILGLPREDIPRFIEFKEATVRPEGASLEEQEEFKQAAGEKHHAYLSAHLEKRKRNGISQDDVIDGLLHTVVDGQRLSDNELIDIIYLLTIAGLDTITSSLSCFVAWLAQHPAERDQLTADPSLWPSAIEELMRFESPVILGHRWTAEDVAINGRLFPQGTKVQVVWSAANMDPDAFENPLEVRLDRQHNNHVGFASGPHRCLGSNLARLELVAAMETLHQRIPDYHVTPGAKPVYLNYGVRAAVVLPLSFTPRS